MAYRLPSLNALRAFEAAARHLSFTRAANELCVTQGAISRHISILEETLGMKLFIRRPRHLELTEVAAEYMRTVQKAFDAIHEGTIKLSVKDNMEPLKIIAPPAFSSSWLLPRLNRFSQLHPDIPIRLVTSDGPVGFDREEVDLSIESSARATPDESSDRLMDVDLIPVCSPKIVNGMRPPKDASELHRYHLLHAVLPFDLWSYWASGVGMRIPEGALKSYFSTPAFVYQAARQGLGIGMGIARYLEEDLAAGTLITPFDRTVTGPDSLVLNIQVRKLQMPRVMMFRNWILNEARAPSSASTA